SRRRAGNGSAARPILRCVLNRRRRFFSADGSPDCGSLGSVVDYEADAQMADCVRAGAWHHRRVERAKPGDSQSALSHSADAIPQFHLADTGRIQIAQEHRSSARSNAATPPEEIFKCVSKQYEVTRRTSSRITAQDSPFAWCYRKTECGNPPRCLFRWGYDVHAYPWSRPLRHSTVEK